MFSHNDDQKGKRQHIDL